MKKLTFTSVYGDELRTVEISSPSGGGGSFHIMETLPFAEEGFYLIGQVVHTLHGWTVYSNYTDSFERSARDIELDDRLDRRSFTQDDKDAILERLVHEGMI